MTHAHTTTARFDVASWAETMIVDIDGDATERNGVKYPGRGFSRAEVGYTYTGAIEGSSVIVYLISYRPGAAPTTGFERFEGSIDGHDGSLVFQHTGEHDAEGVRTTLTIVEGMGTGGLAKMTGEASVNLAGHSDNGYEITLSYDL